MVLDNHADFHKRYMFLFTTDKNDKQGGDFAEK